MDALGFAPDKTKQVNIQDTYKIAPACQKEFCEKTYGTATVQFMRYGFDDKQPVERIQKWCETIQASRHNRFKIKEQDWAKLVNEIVP